MPEKQLLADYLQLGDSRIKVWHAEGEEGFAEDAFATLSAKRELLLSDFRVVGTFPRIQIVLVPSRNEFDRLVRDLLRVEIEVPSHPARIAQPQRTDMVVLSPSAYNVDSTFAYVPEEFRRLLIHEFIHMIEEFLSPDIERIPGWWSEGLAVYYSEQSRHEDGFRGVALNAIATDAVPSLEQVLAERKLSYDWGWTIVQYVESTFGREAILKIVRECSDGDVLAFLGSDSAAFEQSWKGWLRGGGHLGQQV